MIESRVESNSKSRSKLKLELLANFTGTGWSAVVQLACIPLYIKFMGIESYGLIGFYLMLQAILQVLDLGLSPTINRELARYSVQPEKASEARDLVRTLEVAYWLIGLVIGVGLLASSQWIASHWIKIGFLSPRTVAHAVVLMSFLAFFQWPVSFYQGGLVGLHRQVQLNVLRVITVTLSSVGGVLILWLVFPTITAFLAWQIAVSAVHAVLLATLLWKCLPFGSRAPRFNIGLVRSVGRFAAGMSGIALSSLALTQIDKVFVSKLLSLKIFGYYSLAWAVANGLIAIAGAVFTVVFPRMSAQVAAGDEDGLRHSYHTGSQLIAVLILPLAAVLSFFSFDILRVWTGNTETASSVAPILAILVLGSALNALLYLPYLLQLAFGWTSLSLTAGLLSIAVVISLIFPLTKHFGAIGAAAVWAILNILNMLIAVPIMHRRLLRRETWKYFADVGFPLVGTFGMAALCRLMLTNLVAPIATLAAVSGVWLGAVILAVLASPDIRLWAFSRVTNLRLQHAR